MDNRFFDPFDPQALPRKQKGRLVRTSFYGDLKRKGARDLSGLQGNLESLSGGRRVKNLLITSCYDGEGKTVVSVSIALALAGQADAKVLLVDANFSRPFLHEEFSISMAPGLCDLLTDNTTLPSHVIRSTDVRNLSVVPSGPPSSRHIEALRSGFFGERMGDMGAGFDYVIFDGAPAYGASDSLLMVKHFDGVLLVIECERTKWEVAERAKARLLQADGKVLGAVLNKRKYYIPRAIYPLT